MGIGRCAQAGAGRWKLPSCVGSLVAHIHPAAPPAFVPPLPHKQVLFHEQQLDCQLALEDPSPGMPWGRARLQVRERLARGGARTAGAGRGPGRAPAGAPACPPPAPPTPPNNSRPPALPHSKPPATRNPFPAGRRLLRAPVCGAAAAVRGRRRGGLPGLHLTLPKVGLARWQVRSLLCAQLRQAVGGPGAWLCVCVWQAGDTGWDAAAGLASRTGLHWRPASHSSPPDLPPLHHTDKLPIRPSTRPPAAGTL